MACRSTAKALLILQLSALLLNCGGSPSSQPSSSAPVQAPAFESTFTPGGTILNANEDKATSQLPNGKILITGGDFTIGPPPGNPPMELVSKTEVFDPVTGTSIAGPSLQFPRAHHNSVLLADGRTLIVGGTVSPKAQPSNFQANAELIDAAGSSVAAGPVPNYQRLDATAVRLRNGNVLLTGGDAATTLPPFGEISTCAGTMAETYDVANNVFVNNTDLAGPIGHTATVLLDGRVLIAGGRVGLPLVVSCSGSTGTVSTNSAFLFDPSDGSVKQTGNLTISRVNHHAVLLADGRVLLAGGEINPNNLIPVQTGTLEIYDPQTGTFSAAGSFPRDPNFPTDPRFIFAATLLANNQVLLFAESVLFMSAPPAWAVYDPSSQAFSTPMAISGPAFDGHIDGVADPQLYVLPNSEFLLIPPQSTTVLTFK